MGGIIENYKAEMAMVGLQFLNAGVSLISRAALIQGLNPRVFVFYRQSIATLTIAPIAYFSRRKSDECSSMGLKSIFLIFWTSLIGVTINQNLFYEGLYLASSSIGSAMGNLIPAITFVLAAILGIEKIKLGNKRSIAKIGGTILCVGGAISMALLRGPKLLNTAHGPDDWLMGCIFLFGSASCWSFWLILQVAVTKSCSDNLAISAWMCFMAAIQSATFTILIEPNPISWKLNSHLQLLSVLFTGIIGSGVAFFVQAWCISMRGPLFSAMFNPLSTVIVTILGALFLHEQIYMGSMIGGVGVIIGLYVVLWGKAKDLVTKDIDESAEEKEEVICKNIDDVEQPLLLPKGQFGIAVEERSCCGGKCF